MNSGGLTDRIDLVILPAVAFLPLLGCLGLLFFTKGKEKAMKHFAFIISMVTFAVSLYLFFGFDEQDPYMQFVMSKPWMPDYGINFHLGIDGISLLLVMLTTFIMPIVLLSSYSSVTKRVREYMFFMLLLETGMLGTLMALNMFVFYVFWEVMLIPMYFIIGVWGGERRIYAAVKFVIYTVIGSLLMLAAIVSMAWMTKEDGGKLSFEYGYLLANMHLSKDVQYLLFGAFALAFAIKVPMWPFHTWLPDAHVEAPTGGSVILAGVLLKMGTYGFIRFAMPLFPDAARDAVPLFMTLAVIGIIYGALVSLVQTDMKKLVAYSSVSHLGFVMLGLFSMTKEGVTGSVLQMVNHGLSTGALFLCVGVLYERRHTRLISEFGGVAKSMPIFAVLFMIVMLSSLGLPGLNGFVGEFLILLGTFISGQPHAIAYTVLATTGVILAAGYLLWMFQRVMFGPLTKQENIDLADINLREFAYLIPMVVFIIWIGIRPSTFTNKMDKSITHFITQMDKKSSEFRVQSSEFRVEKEADVREPPNGSEPQGRRQSDDSSGTIDEGGVDK